MAALGVHATARPTHVAKQQLEHSAGPDQLPARRVMGQADRIDDRHDLVGLAHLTDQLSDALELIRRDAGDARNHFGRVARVVLLHQLEDRLRVLQRHVALRDRVDRAVGWQTGGVGIRRCGGGVIGLVAPAGDVVLAVRRIVSSEESVLEAVGRLHQEGGVGVVAHVLVVEEVVLQHVVDEAAEVGDVGPGADAGVDIRDR